MKYSSHEKSRESIEAAYDKIIMESFRDRRKSKINLKSNLKKKVEESPAWVRSMTNMVEVPSTTVIGQRAALFALLGVWSVFNPAEGGPAFQVYNHLNISFKYRCKYYSFLCFFENNRSKDINTDDYFCPQVAVSLAACVYFLNDRLKSIGRAFILGYVFLYIYLYN